MLSRGLVKVKKEVCDENKTEIDLETAKKLANLVDKFEEHDDVQHVWVTADIPDEALPGE